MLLPGQSGPAISGHSGNVPGHTVTRCAPLSSDTLHFQHYLRTSLHSVHTPFNVVLISQVMKHAWPVASVVCHLMLGLNVYYKVRYAVQAGL